jgi:uncharacterized membrane protein
MPRIKSNHTTAAWFYATALTIAAGQCAQAAQFKLTILGPVRGESTSQAEFGLNSAGTSVGTSGGQGMRRATLWDRNGRARALSQPRNAIFSRAMDINDSGVAVGAVDTSGAEDLTGLRAVRWSSPDHYEFLLRDNGYDSDALGVNDAGWVIGIRFNGLAYNAYVASPQGRVTWPDPLSPADDFELLSVNRSHVAAGFDSNESGPVAVRWSSQKGVEALALLPGGTLSATAAINDWGTIAGVADDSGGNLRAVRWEANGRISALRSLPNAIYSDTQNGINNWGMSVGVTIYAGTDPNDFNSQRATLWSLRGRPIDLNEVIESNSRYTLITAMAINDCGMIFGDSVDEAGNRFAYKLSPVIGKRGGHNIESDDAETREYFPSAEYLHSFCGLADR